MSRKVIGEGGYGCVHEPSIHCKTPPEQLFTYDNYVSKIMKTKNAESELAEFLIIKGIDPSNQYHLGSPILCKPDLAEPGIKNDLKKCKHINESDISKDPDNYSLLLLKFGGYDLKVFFTNKLTNYLKTNKQNKVDQLLLGFHHLIKGINFFWTNQLVHNDIKPQNILFNPKTGQFKYIDFGLMGKSYDLLNESKNSKNSLGIFHWSYPFDCGFMNQNRFNEYRLYSQESKKKYRDFFIEYVTGSEKNNLLKIPMNNPNAFNILFSYINPELTIPDIAAQTAYINTFFDGFDQMTGLVSNYDKYIENTIQGIDVFGLGFTLQYAVNSLKKKSAISNDVFVRLSSFFSKMYDFNPLSRVIDTIVLLNEYENILLEIGVLTRINKKFENHVLVNKSPINIKLPSSKSSKHLSAELQEYANKDPIELDVKCKGNKEYNPIKKRCVNKCSDGYVRNSNFRCVKSKNNLNLKSLSKPKSLSRSNHSYSSKTRSLTKIRSQSKTRKICPEGKELNPLTNRCVVKCKPGQIRNQQFKCVSSNPRKTKKEMSIFGKIK